jgi:hypothetical protein
MVRLRIKMVVSAIDAHLTTKHRRSEQLASESTIQLKSLPTEKIPNRVATPKSLPIEPGKGMDGVEKMLKGRDWEERVGGRGGHLPRVWRRHRRRHIRSVHEEGRRINLGGWRRVGGVRGEAAAGRPREVEGEREEAQGFGRSRTAQDRSFERRRRRGGTCGLVFGA